MNFDEINALVDDAVSFFTGWATQKQNYESQLSDKDKQIADLTAKLQTATSTVQADESEIGTLHDKLTNLSNLIKGQPTSVTTTTPAAS